jgi:drug/metabolite transporter (DMT)-like permease
VADGRKRAWVPPPAQRAIILLHERAGDVSGGYLARERPQVGCGRGATGNPCVEQRSEVLAQPHRSDELGMRAGTAPGASGEQPRLLAPCDEVARAAKHVVVARPEAVLDGVHEVKRWMAGDELQVGGRVHGPSVPAKRGLLVPCTGEGYFAGASLMAAVLLAVTASVAWGTSDFLGGIAARYAQLPLVLAGSQLVGLLAFVPVLLLQGTPMPHDSRLLLGLAAGVIAVGELGLIYFALRRGPAIVMAPIAALSAVVPVLVGIADGDHMDVLIVVGLICALGGAVAASWTRGEDRQPRRQALLGAAVAGGAALGAGTVLALIGVASKADAWWAIAAVRAGGVVTAVGVLAAAVVVTRGRVPWGPSRGGLRPWTAAGLSVSRGTALMIAAIGLSDITADTAFANATHAGALSVVSVLASLYPVTTIALGTIALRERPAHIQLGGAALACLGAAVLAVRTA